GGRAPHDDDLDVVAVSGPVETATTPRPTREGSPPGTPETPKEPMPHRPLLFLDVDGPLIPYAVGEGRPSPGYAPLRLGGARRWLNPRHGAALLALPYRPVWATTWEHDANEVLAPLLGLPELPVVEWPRPEERTSELQSSENLVCRLQLE